jgi:NADPH2:quinone reductase
MMDAAIVDKLGDAPRAGRAEAPVPRTGQVTVEVSAAALNPLDLVISSGQHPIGKPPVPHVPGVEGVGRLADGTRVWFSVQGGFVSGSLARYTAVAETACAPVPAELPDPSAAAVGAVGTSALISLRDRAGLRAGERVLVLGATGAFGQMFVQLAKVLGAAHVAAAGRDAGRLAGLTSIGADAVIELDHLAGVTGEGYDVVVDPLWGRYAALGLGALAAGGRMLNVGQAAGPTAEVSGVPLRHRGASLIGFSGATATPAEVVAAYREVAGLVVAGRIRVDLATYPLAEIATAWQAQAASPGRKVVVTM